ncbi:monocarboxylate transporter 9 isoform X1 [Athalia rosae]|uniref:monocarboxylate transporter 9 isoform X1 n=2 Tax=Athalia rosae TaxID=37344 RepID=UPI002033E335|nr:monocarboxylate transporter 9 isoform X1 [Athalia rosae]
MAGGVDSKKEDKLEIKEKPERQPIRFTQEITREDLAPDGGWGYMVAFATVLSYTMSLCQGTSFGLLYGGFLNEGGNGGKGLAFLNLMFMLSFSLTGLLCNLLLKHYKMRTVGLIGSLIYFIANSGCALVPNVFWLGILFFVQGFGIGLMLSVCNLSFNAYFVKKRAKVNSVCQALVGLGGVMYPYLTEVLMATYGFRGCAAILGALSSHTVFGMLIMQPVEWHYKKLQIIVHKSSVNEEVDKSVTNSNTYLGIPDKNDEWVDSNPLNVESGWEKNRSIPNLRGEMENVTPLLVDSLKRSQGRTGSGDNFNTELRQRSLKRSSLDYFANRISALTATSVSSVSGIGTPGEFRLTADPEPNKNVPIKKTVRSILGDFFEVSLLRDPIFCNINIGMSMVFLCDINFTGFLPMLLTDVGYTSVEIAMVLTAYSIADVIGKILLAVFTSFVRIKARYIFLFATYCLFVIRFVFFYCTTRLSRFVVITLSGVARAWFSSPQGLVIAEYCSFDKIAAGYGLFTTINGAISLILLPVIGFVKDYTNSYDVLQCMFQGVMLICLIPWTIEIFFTEVVHAKKKKSKSTSDGT